MVRVSGIEGTGYGSEFGVASRFEARVPSSEARVVLDGYGVRAAEDRAQPVFVVGFGKVLLCELGVPVLQRKEKILDTRIRVLRVRPNDGRQEVRDGIGRESVADRPGHGFSNQI